MSVFLYWMSYSQDLRKWIISAFSSASDLTKCTIFYLQWGRVYLNFRAAVLYQWGGGRGLNSLIVLAKSSTVLAWCFLDYFVFVEICRHQRKNVLLFAHSKYQLQVKVTIFHFYDYHCVLATTKLSTSLLSCNCYFADHWPIIRLLIEDVCIDFLGLWMMAYIQTTDWE